MEKKITETAQDLAASLDKADQTKSPEHLYGASDNMRNRLQQTADATRKMVEQSTSEAAKRREQLTRLDNPALAKLEEAGRNLAMAESAARSHARTRRTKTLSKKRSRISPRPPNSFRTRPNCASRTRPPTPRPRWT